MVPVQTSDQMDAMLNRMFSRPGMDTVSYSVEQQTLRMAGQQVLRSAWDEAHATQFYKRDRSMVERSINHPYIGLYGLVHVGENPARDAALPRTPALRHGDPDFSLGVERGA